MTKDFEEVSRFLNPERPEFRRLLGERQGVDPSSVAERVEDNLLAHWQAYEGTAPLGAYIRTIVTRRKQELLRGLGEGVLDHDSIEAVFELPAEGEDPVELLDRPSAREMALRVKAVVSAVEKFDEVDKLIFFARMEDPPLPYKLILDRLGTIPANNMKRESAVRARHTRLVAELRQAYESTLRR
ncbi:MAG TPA: hypothetical protein VFV19_16100 [Candidatus Polarisedimenticolaceae bacterium]|nr:hypothetical protein [Candidatus Polarisedimenticolaceae bacterium]